MPRRRFLLRFTALTAVLGSALLLGQPKPSASSMSLVREFPVTMQQNVIAGKTPVGTKVEAKLTIATLVDGTVIPEGAIFSGEVVESAAKSAGDPSRLAVCMDAVHWKKGSAPIKVYLTAWYYPIRMPTDEDRSDDRFGRNPNSTYSPTFPGRTPSGADSPHAPYPSVSDNRVVMKDVESTRNNDGALVLTSTHSNLKLDKSTTYVLATGDLTPVKPAK